MDYGVNEPLSTFNKYFRCDHCEQEQALKKCFDCELLYCIECVSIIHSKVNILFFSIVHIFVNLSLCIIRIIFIYQNKIVSHIMVQLLGNVKCPNSNLLKFY